MSAFGGIYFYDKEARVEERELTSLGESLCEAGPDGGGQVVVGSVGMTYRAFHTNRESRLETQPFVVLGTHMLAWDGRLDNREELVSQLDFRTEGRPTDVEIVMASYRKWGVDFLRRLIGDFALSLWDEMSRTLLLARDPVGARTLTYHRNKNRVVWSSELLSLLSLSDVNLEVDDEYIADYLTWDPEPSLTPYKALRAVRPGHALVICNGQMQERRFWALDPGKEIRYKSDGEYIEHFVDEFTNAVRCRLRSDRPVFAELSGGLDSSSIVCVGDRILANGGAQTQGLETVSRVYEECRTADERRFIRHVEEQRGRASHYVFEEQYRMLTPVSDEALILSLNTCLVSAEYHRGLSDVMGVSGSRVLLSGQGGDEMLNSGNDPMPELADLVAQIRPFELIRRLQIWSKVLKSPYLKILWSSAIVPSLPRRVQARLKWKGAVGKPSWFNGAFASRMDLRERMLAPKDVFGFGLPSGRDQAAGFISVVRHIAAGYRRGISKFEVSYPYTHRPLVEFLQAIPPEQRARPGQTRALLRSGMLGVVPERILKRKGKGDPQEVICRAIAREYSWISALFKDARVCARGYVNADAVKDALERARHGVSTKSFLLLKVIPLEIWLRALESRDTRAERSIGVGRPPASQSTAVPGGSGTAMRVA